MSNTSIPDTKCMRPTALIEEVSVPYVFAPVLILLSSKREETLVTVSDMGH